MKYPNIDTYHLIVFYYVANEKSITSAAEELCLAQPTVTGHIKALENDLGVKLVEVDRKRINLTPAGEGLYHYAREIYTQAVAAERFIEHIKYSSIDIGSSPLFVSAIAGAVNTLSERLHSAIKVNIQFGSHSRLLQDVIDSKLDLAILPDLGYVDDKVSRIRISDGVKLVFYASPVHPVFKKETLEWKDICSYPLLVGKEPSTARKIISDRLVAEGVNLPLNLDLAADNVECCKILVQNGRNISVALKEDIEHELNEGKLRLLSLPGDIWMVVDAIAHRGTLTSPLIQHFISFAKASF